jgi:transposase
MCWSGKYRGFVIEAFIKNNDTVSVTQREFRMRFGLYVTDAVPDRKTILRWVSNVRASGSALPWKQSGRPRNIRTPENVQRVPTSREQSARHSTQTNAFALGISH